MGAFNTPYGLGVSDDVFAVTPADADGVTDGTTIRPLIRGLFITTGGALKYTSASGVVNTITVPSGLLLHCAIKRVWATGTTATGLLGYV